MIISVARQMAAVPIPTIPESRFGNVTSMFFNGTNQTSQPPNWTPGITQLISIYPDFMGPIAFLLIFLIPFGMIWMAHGNMKMLGILGMLVGVFVFAYLPSNFVAAAVICIVVSLAGTIWGLLKQ